MLNKKIPGDNKGFSSRKDTVSPWVPSGVDFPVVSIGASAGGLAALETFFKNMPADNKIGIAFILIQHQAPDRKSILSKLIERYTKLNVYNVEDGMMVEPDSIYIIPPSRDIEFLKGRFHLKEPTAPRWTCIDYIFRSIARDQQEKAICIVLSGNGTDGSLGLKEIKGEGGMVMAQDPETADYDGMPRSAIATGMVDYVLPPAEMPAQLISYIKNKYERKPFWTGPLGAKTIDSLNKVFFLLKSQTRHDFSHYKKNTTLRRIERRMAVNQIERMEDYVHYLEQNSKEVETLFRELLIGVTSFFRDPDAFDILKKQVIPQLFFNKNPGDTIRVWVPGCSTGEEAYSIAILIREHLDTVKQQFNVQIFATDIDNRSVELARTGLYPASIAADVSPERLTRFFTLDRDGHFYQIAKTIREMLIFAEQSLIQDPPFSRLDFISCRNLLIFMDVGLQKNVLYLFHYALNHNGFVFLGSSETIGELSDLFNTVDIKWKVYQNKGIVIPRPTLRTLASAIMKSETISRALSYRQRESKPGIREQIEKYLLKNNTPPCVVINKLGDIFYIHGRTGKYLEPAPGENRMNILQMAREGLRVKLTAAVRKAAAQNEPVYYRGLCIGGNGETNVVNLTVMPFSEVTLNVSDLTMVIFEEIVLPEGENQWREEAAALNFTADDEHIFSLERELQHKEEYLKTVIEELETSNEELQSTNEEFQSTNEELETSKEELQSVNEEIMTVNMDLQNKIEELSQANNDMNNMLTGTDVGVVFVNCQMRIQRFTPAAVQIINLIHTDLGRPLGHISTNLIGNVLLDKYVQAVIDNIMPQELEAQTRDGRYYLIRILPYRTLENAIEGAVLTFIDITEQRHSQDTINRLDVIVRDSNDAITMQDMEGRILAWNPAAEKLYGWNQAEALAMNICETIPPSKREEALEMVKKLAQSEKMEPYQTQRVTRDGRIIDIWMTASVLLNKEGKPYALATMERSNREL